MGKIQELTEQFIKEKKKKEKGFPHSSSVHLDMSHASIEKRGHDWGFINGVEEFARWLEGKEEK